MVAFTKLVLGTATLLVSQVLATNSTWPSDGSTPSRDVIISQAVKQVENIIESTTFSSNCTKCLAGLEVGKFLALTYPDIVPDILTELCTKEKYSTFDPCDVAFGKYSTTEGTSGSDITNVLQLIDAAGLDGEYICYYQLNGACPLPETPKFDLSSWWPEKPTNLTLPTPSNETFNVIHVSDLHVQLTYQVGSEANCSQYMCCTSHNYNEDAPNGTVLEPAGTWGGYYCDVPPVLLDNSLQTIGNLSSNFSFEFAIFTGDMVDHDDDQYLSLSYTIESEEEIYYALKNNLKGIPVYATLGNHDSFPYGQIAQNSSGFANKFEWNTDLAGDLWADRFGWVSSEVGDQIRTNYAAYATTTNRGLRVISLNSNFWYTANYYNYWNTTQPDESGVFKFLVDELVASEQKGQRVWIVAHVPTGGDTSNALPGPTAVFGQIIERFSPFTIAGVFFGHTHEDQFQIFYADNGSNRTAENALQVAYLAESITPLSEYNPGWRYYKVDTETFSIMDSVNYYFPLNDTFGDNNAIPEWHFGYSARETYDLNNTWPSNAPLNGTFWHHAAQNIYNTKSLRDSYLSNEYRRSPYVPSCDTLNCRNSMLCYFSSGTVDQALACEKQYNLTDPVFL
ncbi:hypothetical protein AWJ20_1575 [Sugiyamaella lignohabitans]|uniref:Sphingomyelin phosphodiesterase n=1 Tax=Sugiyamaella lignohabitans TaxID=796027 RepID=A0A167DU23_9ASCO|nr:uncharacterized protein AWJ20_1575 [Sugiyamaella lignohabitans]ANB13291.1 hypothetical protein AWJ20_1575 [Sugiyamaella lignohabitans]